MTQPSCQPTHPSHQLTPPRNQRNYNSRQETTAHKRRREHDSKEDDTTAFVTKAEKAKAGREFSGSRKRELEGKIQNGTFVPFNQSGVAEGTRIFGPRFIDALKKVGDDMKKSRLVAKNCSDQDAT